MLPRTTPAKVVLVPGLGLDERSSARLRALVPADVVLLPGAGRRARVESLDGLAGLLRARLGKGPVLLVGHSQGCQVAAAAAVDPRVRGLVLLGPTTDPRLRRPATLAREWLRTAVREPLGQAPLIVAQWLRTGPRAMRALWRVAAPDPLDARLRALAVPVTVVRGAHDRLCDAGWARHLATAAPAGRLVELAGAHMTVQTHPARIAEVLTAELGRLGAGLDPGEAGA